MAALDFPDNPTVGELYGSSGSVWRWDGARWASTAGASGARGRVAYAQITAAQGSITTFVDIAGLSVTWTADPTRTYKITVFGHMQNTLTGTVNAVHIRDAAGTIQTSSNLIVGAAGFWELETATVVQTGLSGSVTRKVTASATNGTGTFQASPTTPAFILVEDITYEAGTSGTPGGGSGFVALPKLIDADQNGITTSNVSLTGYSITLNVVLGRLYEVSWVISFQQSAAAGQVSFRLNGPTGPNAVYFADVPSGSYKSVAGVFHFVGGSAVGNLPGYAVGPQTISMSGYTSAGGINIKSGTMVNGRFAIKDIGPSA